MDEAVVVKSGECDDDDGEEGAVPGGLLWRDGLLDVERVVAGFGSAQGFESGQHLFVEGREGGARAGAGWGEGGCHGMGRGRGAALMGGDGSEG